MTEGISKEELIRLKETMTDWQSKLFIHLLIKKCTELDPWIPVDENTPKDMNLLLINSLNLSCYIGYFDSFMGIWCMQGTVDFIPRHYKLLPEDPK